MKNARPPLAPSELESTEALLTTGDVARLLRVHPKHVYRLLRRGLPGHRIGGEWRFDSEEVRRWSGARRRPAVLATARKEDRSIDLVSCVATSTDPPPLVAANGDIVVECLLAHLTAEGRPLLGLVQADRALGLELLQRGMVLAAGCHGGEVPRALRDERIVFIHLVERQVGLAVRRGVRLRSLRNLGRWRLASRPPTAGVRSHLDGNLRREGIDPEAIHAKAAVLPSHREVVCAVARGEADVGLASEAWSNRVGLECIPLCRESYGLLVRARLLGDPRIVHLCEVAQSAAFRKELAAVCGYESNRTGAISYE